MRDLSSNDRGKLMALLFLSLGIRALLLPFESRDYDLFLGPWYDQFLEHGRFHALGGKFSDYYAPYLCLLSLSTLLPLPKLYAMKLISIVFDYLAAFIVYRIVERQYPSSPIKYAAFMAMLFLPTILLNSALWGQCDIIFTTALLAMLWGVICSRPCWALIAFGVAMAFKPQAIFLGPFLGGLFLKGILPWRYVWVPLAAYWVCGLPSILAGKPVAEVLLHWLRQHNLPDLTAGATNIYQWLPKQPHQVLWGLGVVLGVVAGLLLMLSMKRTFVVQPFLSAAGSAKAEGCNRTSEEHGAPSDRLKPALQAMKRQEWLVTTALLSVLAMPFFLPGMHERYFLPPMCLPWFMPSTCPGAGLWPCGCRWLPFSPTCLTCITWNLCRVRYWRWRWRRRWSS
jgi:hypothetical protein